MILMFTKYQSLFKITVSKCLIILEMFNFSLNFFFYIICSKTSRTELHLILYYLFYWQWTNKCKKLTICNHPNHNPNYMLAHRTLSTNSRYHPNYNSNTNLNQASNAQSILYTHTVEKKNLNIFNFFKRKSRLKIYCFLDYSTRNKSIGSKRRSSYVGTQNNNPTTNHKINNHSNVLIESSCASNASQKQSFSNSFKFKKRQSSNCNLKVDQSFNSLKRVADNNNSNSLGKKSFADSFKSTFNNNNSNCTISSINNNQKLKGLYENDLDVVSKQSTSKNSDPCLIRNSSLTWKIIEKRGVLAQMVLVAKMVFNN